MHGCTQKGSVLVPRRRFKCSHPVCRLASNPRMGYLCGFLAIDASFEKGCHPINHQGRVPMAAVGICVPFASCLTGRPLRAASGTGRPPPPPAPPLPPHTCWVAAILLRNVTLVPWSLGLEELPSSGLIPPPGHTQVCHIVHVVQRCCVCIYGTVFMFAPEIKQSKISSFKTFNLCKAFTNDYF